MWGVKRISSLVIGHPSSPPRSESGQTLIAMMISIVIIMILVLVVWGGPGISQKQSVSTARQVMRKAQTVDCMSLLRQYRGLIVSEIGTSEGGGADISRIASPRELRCPISGLRYRFDPSNVSDGRTAGLWCPYPGHTGL